MLIYRTVGANIAISSVEIESFLETNNIRRNASESVVIPPTHTHKTEEKETEYRRTLYYLKSSFFIYMYYGDGFDTEL